MIPWANSTTNTLKIHQIWARLAELFRKQSQTTPTILNVLIFLNWNISFEVELVAIPAFICFACIFEYSWCDQATSEEQ